MITRVADGMGIGVYLKKRCWLWLVVLLVVVLVSLGWLLCSWLTVPPLTPVAIIHGRFIGDLSPAGILTLQDQILYQYDWAGKKQAEYTLPKYDLYQPRSGWSLSLSGMILCDWASADFQPMQIGELISPIDHNRALPYTGQLARFSPSGECVGALSYQRKVLLVKVWRHGELLSETKLPLDPHGQLNGRQVVDLLVADDGWVLLYWPSSPIPEPLLLVGRSTPAPKALQALFRSLIDQYLKAQPAVLPADVRGWFLNNGGQHVASPSRRHVFRMKTLISPRNPRDYLGALHPEQGKESLGVYAYPGRLQSRLVTTTFSDDIYVEMNIPFPNGQELYAVKSVSEAYLSPDGHSVLIQSNDEPAWGILSYK